MNQLWARHRPTVLGVATKSGLPQRSSGRYGHHAVSNAHFNLHRTHFLSFFLPFLVLISISTVCLAQDAPVGTGDTPVPAEETTAAKPDPTPDNTATPADSPEIITQWRSPALTLPGYGSLQNSWPAVSALLVSEDFRTAHVQLESLLAIQHDQGVRNFVSAALVILRAARRAVELGEADLGVALAQSAQKHAPDLPHVRLGHARLLLDAGKLAPGPMMAEIATGIARLWTHLPTRLRLMGNLLMVAMLLVVLMSLLFVLIIAVRYTALLGHDLKNFAPKGIRGSQMALLFVVVSLLPLVFGVGIIYWLFLWLVIFWLYMNWREKVVAVVILLAFMGMRYANDYAARLMGYDQTWYAAAYECTNGLCDQTALAKLHEVVEQEGNPLALLTLGSYHHRRAHNDSASAALAEGFLVRAVSVAPDDPYALTAAGNYRLAEAMSSCKTNMELSDTQMQAANDYYQKALDVNPGFLPALYNWSHLLRRAGQIDDADALYRRAQSADDGRLYFFERQVAGTEGTARCPGAFNVNRQLIPSGIPDSRIVSGIIGQQSPISAAFLLVPYSDLLVGSVGHGPLPIITLSLLVIMFALGPFRSLLRGTWFCSRCGKIANARENPELEELDDCDECLLIRVKGNFVDPKDLWFRQRRIESDRQGRRQRMRLLTFLLPGAGHLYGGRTLRGVVYATLFMFLLVSLIIPSGMIRDSYAMDAVTSWPQMTLLALLAFVVYVISLADIYAVNDPRR